MNFLEIKDAIKYLQKTCKCQKCSRKYKQADIYIMAAAKQEAVAELKCRACKFSTIVTVSHEKELSAQNYLEDASRTHRKVTPNDVLDVKNFLNNFDGDLSEVLNQNNNEKNY
ncbi:hypothetical protein KJ632_01830 [Patescibacteria group bacterium]|nr:hypothetical protein [Patescibacteria group bacterium]